LRKMMAAVAEPPCQEDTPIDIDDAALCNKLLNAAARKKCNVCPERNSCNLFKNMSCRLGLPGYDCPKNLLWRMPGKHPARNKKIFINRHGDAVNIIGFYRGQSCFLMCNGPSVTNYEKHLLNQPGILTMGMNNGAANADFRPDLWTAQDPPYKFMAGIYNDPKILKFTLWDYKNYLIPNPSGPSRKLRTLPGMIFHKRHSAFHAEKWFEEEKIVWGRPKDSGGNRSTMLGSLHILWFLGFENVYLLGADFHMDAETKYFFDQNRTGSAIRNNNRLYKNMIKYFAQLQPLMLEQGFKVWNCNPQSKLHVFPFMSLESAIRKNVINTSVSTLGMYEKVKKPKPKTEKKK